MMEDALTEIASMVEGAYLKGRGMMRGVDVGSGELAGDICATAFQNGLIVETSGPNDEVVKILAPLTIPDETLEAGLKILVEAAQSVTGNLKIAAE